MKRIDPRTGREEMTAKKMKMADTKVKRGNAQDDNARNPNPNPNTLPSLP